MLGALTSRLLGHHLLIIPNELTHIEAQLFWSRVWELVELGLGLRVLRGREQTGNDSDGHMLFELTTPAPTYTVRFQSVNAFLTQAS